MWRLTTKTTVGSLFYLKRLNRLRTICTLHSKELERCSAELVSTDGLDEKQREAVEQFNAGLAIDGRTQEVAELTAKLSELETINGQINHT